MCDALRYILPLLTWDVANVRRVRLLALPGAVGDASDCSDAPTARAGLASGTP